MDQEHWSYYFFWGFWIWRKLIQHILPKCSETKLLSLVLFSLRFEFISVVMNIFSDIFSHNCFLLLLRNVVSSSFHTWCIITVLLCLESQDTEELFIYLKWIFRQFLNCTSTESVDLFFISSWNCKNERFKRKWNGRSLFSYGNHIIVAVIWDISDNYPLAGIYG